MLGYNTCLIYLLSIMSNRVYLKNNCNLRRVVISENVNFDFCSSKLHQLILSGKRRMPNDENELDNAKINIQT